MIFIKMSKSKLTINFITSNKNKVKEFKQILEPQIKVNHIEISYPELRSDAPEEIAKMSAEMLANKLRKPVVVEDSGLFIKALNDFPGTCSAYIHRRIELHGIIKLMEGIEDRECTYKSAVAYCEPGKKPISFLGEEIGYVARSAKGNFGFGHDPIFIPEGSNKTYGEIKNCEEVKKFRRRAVEKLRNYLLPKLNDTKTKNIITIIAAIIFIILGIKYIISSRRALIFDVIFSILIVGFFYKFYNKLHQDYKSYFALIFALVLHDLFLYDTSPFGIRFDHYMHFVGGFTIALITDRAFNEKFGKIRRFTLLVIFALGFGVIGEIVEWLGYQVLGLGEGFFLYGIGDEGEWINAILDLIFNGLGAITMAVIRLFRITKTFKSYLPLIKFDE